jgi:hypothetical protein
MSNFLYERIYRTDRDAIISRNASNTGTLAKKGMPAIAVIPATAVTPAAAGRQQERDPSIRRNAGDSTVTMKEAGDTLKTREVNKL